MKMNKIVAVCGLICDDCIAFIATQKNDDKLRENVVKEWSFLPLRLEDVNCDGCIAGKRLHKFCRECEVRKCGFHRSIENCAYCDEFPCGKLEKLWRSFKTVSGEDARANLVETRKRIPQ